MPALPAARPARVAGLVARRLATVGVAAALVAGAASATAAAPATATGRAIPEATSLDAGAAIVVTVREAFRHGDQAELAARFETEQIRAAAEAKARAEARAKAKAERQRKARAAARERASRAAIRNPKGTARTLMADTYGWRGDQYRCLETLWQRESGWSHRARNRSSGAYGIPQALPARKMASAGADWRTNPRTQIVWGLRYIKDRYGTPCSALGHSDAVGWY